MQVDPRPTLSRWGRSSYETAADLVAEAAALEDLVQLRGTRTDAQILVVTSGTRVDAGLLDRAPSARLVITTTSGYDHLDEAALVARGVVAARLPEVRRDAVVEASLELILAGLRQSGWLRAEARKGRWARSSMPQLGMRTLRGSTVGVVGLGVIGARMARTLQALGARVVGTDPKVTLDGVEALPLDEMLGECDVLTLHCHLTDGTRALLNASRLARARPGLVVVNTARGDLLDLDAAVRLLEQGVLAAVGVDVFPTEPYPRLREAAEHPALLYTPHSAGYHDGLSGMVRAGLVRTVSSWIAGQALPYPVPFAGADSAAGAHPTG